MPSPDLTGAVIDPEHKAAMQRKTAEAQQPSTTGKDRAKPPPPKPKPKPSPADDGEGGDDDDAMKTVRFTVEVPRADRSRLESSRVEI